MTDWTLFIPELFTLTVSLVFLCLTLTRSDARRDQTVATILSAIGGAVCVATAWKSGTLF